MAGCGVVDLHRSQREMYVCAGFRSRLRALFWAEDVVLQHVSAMYSTVGTKTIVDPCAIIGCERLLTELMVIEEGGSTT